MALASTARAEWIFNYAANAQKSAAGACPINDIDDTAQQFCFYASCEGGGPLRFEATTSKIPVLQGETEFDIRVIVDNQIATTLEFVRFGQTHHYNAPLEQYQLRALEMLRNGRRAELQVVIGRSAPVLRMDLSLRGSGRAIGQALAACPMPDFAARDLQRRITADPAKHAGAPLLKECTEVGGTMTVEPGYAEWTDIDGVGGPDVRVNWGAAVCDAAPRMYCGTAGCTHSLYVAQPDGMYRRVFTDNMHGFQTEGPGIVRIHFHGSYCGRVGAEACSKRYRMGPVKLEEIP